MKQDPLSLPWQDLEAGPFEGMTLAAFAGGHVARAGTDKIKPVRLKNVFLAILILGLASLACLGPALATPGDYVEEFGGDISIYTRILSMTDCTELQREFERADESSKQQEPGTQEYRTSIGYRTAADNRMKEVECEGDL